MPHGRLHATPGRVGVVFALLFCAVIFAHQFGPEVTSAASSAKPERMKNQAAGNCAGCHGADRALPSNHVATSTMNGKACRTCHKEGKSLLRTKIPLSHTHDLNGVSCEKCHGPGKPSGPVMTEQCLTCHGTADDVAKKTSAVKPNPHNNPHQGTSLDCDLCHHMHIKSENYCSQCHMFKYNVP
jgi:RecJ-like exonuclease